MATVDQEPIAIIGMACRFPGGSTSPSKLWDLLKSPRNLSKRVPDDRFNSTAYFHPNGSYHGATDSRDAYFLEEDVARFDNAFFNIQPAEAEAIDPQQRLLMETVYDSLCAGGQTIERLRGTNTGIYVGMMCDDWAQAINRDWEATMTYAATGESRAIVSNRVSYFFDWHGPSMTVDTACSSSLVAVHQGVSSLRTGECPVAIAAGVNLILGPGMWIAESKLHMLSPTGTSKMWDASADGYARGEGIAAVVMKRLSDALRDGDPIEGVIRGTGVNQDGKTAGVTMPNGIAQAELIRDTYRRAGLDIHNPRDRPQFFHAHGTGTQAGDPQEAQAIASAFFSGSDQELDTLAVGSIKTIIGHTEGSAGLASLIGSTMALKHGTIPPNIHFENLSPKVAPFYTHLSIPTTAIPWPALAPGVPRRVSVNSFGFGGLNAHAIIESYEPSTASTALEQEATTATVFTPLTVSAASASALKATLADIRSYLEACPDVNMRDLAHTLQSRRSTLAYRKDIMYSSREDAMSKIDALLGDDANAAENGLTSRYLDVPNAHVLGIFTGQGAQWPRMGARLIEQSPFAARRIKELDLALSRLPEGDRPTWTLYNELLAGPEESRLSQAAISQPLCTAVQIVLIDLLKDSVKFSGVVGHSSGEIGAAYAAGFLSAPHALYIAYYRGFYAHLAGSDGQVPGAMLAVGTSYEDASDFCELDDFVGRIQVAARNSATSVTLSGDRDAVEEAEAIFKDEGKFARALKVDTAYHSYHMLPCVAPYLAALAGCGITIQEGNGIPWYSSVKSGRVMSKDDLSTHGYWVENMVSTVLFEPAVETAVSHAGHFDMGIEVGPHPALKGPCLDTLKAATGKAIPYTGLLARGKDDRVELALALGSIWRQLGACSVDFDTFETRISGQLVPKRALSGLPTYPFDHARRFYSLTRFSGSFLHAQGAPHPLLGRRSVEIETDREVSWRQLLRPNEISWIQGHQLQGQAVFPAMGFVAMAIEAAATLAGTDRELGLLTLENVTIPRALTFGGDDAGMECRITMTITSNTKDELRGNVACYSGVPFGSGSPLVLNFSTDVTVAFHTPRPDTLPSSRLDEINLGYADEKRLYSQFTSLGYNYSTPFTGVRSISRKMDFATGEIEDEAGDDWEDQLLLHPGFLDSAIQTGFAAYAHPYDNHLWALHIPTDVRSIMINPYFLASRAASRNRRYAYQTATRTTPETPMMVDIAIFSDDGEQTQRHPFLQFESVGVKPFAQATARDDALVFSRTQYRPAEPDAALALESIGEVFSEHDMAALLAAERLSFFRLRRLSEMTTESESLEVLPLYKRLLDNATRLVELVAAGNHPHVPQEASGDSIGKINSLTSMHRNHPFVKLAEVAGKHLEDEIRSGGSMLEFLAKDNLLDEFQSKLALMAHACLAATVAQIAYRYPRMNILEIGAGAGDTTHAVLSALDGAFETYAYTDISDEPFANAQRRFDTYSDRMLFSKYNMDQAPAEQGLEERSVDLVLAASSLWMTANPDEMMANARRLLKPGGFLVVADFANNDLMTINLTLGSLPCWYAALENDPSRSHGPCISLDQWTTLTGKHGFAGFDAVPFANQVQTYSVFICQAVDNRILSLREPLSTVRESPASQEAHDGKQEVSTQPEGRGQLIVVGGRKAATAKLVGDASALLSTRYRSIIQVPSLEVLNTTGIAPGSTILSLTELDEQYLESRTEAKLEALKTVWRNARTILHVTTGARNSSPYSGMVLGLSRVVRFEYPNINLQVLDFDSATQPTATIIAESLVRLELGRQWSTEDHAADDLLWSLEPEVYYVKGKALIPRCLPLKDANVRYNTCRRPIPVDVDPSEVSVVLEASPSGTTFELGTASPLRVLPVAQAAETCTLRTKYSLMGAIKMHEAAWLSLCQGTDTTTGHEVIALLDHAAESRVCVPVDWTVRVPNGGSTILAAVAAYLLAKSILDTAPRFGSIIVHEAHPSLRDALTRQAAAEGVHMVFTTTKQSDKGSESTQHQPQHDGGSIWVHPNLPLHLVQRLVPRQTSFFVNLAAPDCASAALLKRCLAPGTTVRLESDFIRPAPSVQSSHVDVIKEIGQEVKEASQRVTMSAQRHRKAAAYGSGAPQEISLRSIQNSRVAYAALSIVDWQTSSVQALQRPIDHGIIFRDNVTYLLFGLAGELGQSLCSWMVLHGARHVVLASRQPKVHPRFIDGLADEYGANVRAMTVNLTSRASLDACYATVQTEMPPVAGVAHGALVLADALFDDLAFDAFDRTAAPKVEGSVLLDEIFYDAPLDFFILFTSAVGVSGNTGQSAYIMANNFMTSLAAQRRDVRGVAGSDLALAAMAGLGHFERSEHLDKDHFAKMGYRDSSEQDFHRLFAEAILAGRPENAYQGCSQVASGLKLVRKTPDVQAQLREDPKFCHYILPDASALDRQGKAGAGQGGKTARARVRLATVKTRSEARAAVKDAFVEKLKRALMIPPDEALNEELTFVEQGMDSILAVEIRTWFLAEIEVDLPVLQILGAGTTVQAVVDRAMDKIPPSIVEWEKLVNDDGGANTSDVPPAAAAVIDKGELFSLRRTEGTGATPSTVDTGTTTPVTSGSTSDTSLDGLSEADDHADDEKSGTQTQTHGEAAAQDVLLERQRKQAIVSSATEHIEPMTYGQKRMWFLTHYVDDPTTLNFAYIAKLRGPLRANDLARAVESVAQRHESLRTRFFWSDDATCTPMQSILSKPLVRLETAHLEEDASAAAVEAELTAMRDYEWDLGDWVPVRLRLLSISDTEHYLLMGSHHISLDGHSFTIMMMDIEEAYLAPGQRISVLPDASQARAFSDQQRLAYESGGFQKALDMYRRVLPPQDVLHPLELFSFARTQVRPPQDSWRTHVAERVLEPSIAAAVNQIARKRRSTSFHAYLAGFQALLFRLLPSSTTDKVFIGMADANRLDSKFMRSIGNLLNILPLRFDRAVRQSFGDAIESARAKTHTALEHSALPFDLLLDELSVPRSNRWTPIFQVLIDYRLVPSRPAGKPRNWAGCEVSEETWQTSRSGYDVVLEIKEDQNETTLRVHVQKALYDQAAAELLLNSYMNILRQVTEQGERTDLTKLDKWNDEDVQKALAIGRGPTMKLEWPATVAHQIAQVIERHPDSAALKDGHGAALTYAAMNQRVEEIASTLRANLPPMSKQEEQIVGVFQTPSADFVCSLLAIHRVGAVYLPLDLRNGAGRLASTVKAAQPVAILTDKECVSRTNELELALGGHDGQGASIILNVADIRSGPISEEITLSVGAKDVAYMIFTSGSTGEPKGIVVRHENLRANLEGFHRAWDVEDLGKVVLQNAAFSFDGSLLQIFAALTTGGCLVVAPADARGDPNEITHLMAEHGVTMTQATPSEYEMWFRFAPENIRRCTAWKAAWFGGERAAPGLLHLFREACKVLPNLRVFTSYGPTEVTISAIKGRAEIEDPNVTVPVPGFVLPNYAAYIVDEAMQPVPIGVAGEIVFGGSGVGSNEYWHRPDLTAAAFLPDRFAANTDDGPRMYRTGDFGQLDQDGRLTIKGRIAGDTQVKLRGFRIELAEIEGVILREAGGRITNAVVTLRGTDVHDTFLAAHVTIDASKITDPQEEGAILNDLRTRLPLCLPLYMCPSTIVTLADMPLTAHSKVDRRAVQALPLPDFVEGDAAIIAQDLTWTERRLATLWATVLPLQRLSLTQQSDFFMVGGSSLVLVKLQAAIKGEFGDAPRLSKLMSATTLGSMAAELDAGLDTTVDWDKEMALDLIDDPSTTEPTMRVRRTSLTYGLSVLVTGATGHIGRRIINQLACTGSVRRIICLVRPAEGRDIENLFPGVVAQEKLHVLMASLPTLPTDVELSDIDVVLHSAANRTFWDSYSAAKPVNVDAVKALAQLCLRKGAALHVLSSGAAAAYEQDNCGTPDTTLPRPTSDDGYVSSKWVAERYLANAARLAGLNVTLHRPIQTIAPPEAVAEQATEAEAYMARSLLAAAPQLAVRPDFAHVDGWMDVAPLAEIADAVAAAVANTSAHSDTGLHIVDYPGETRVRTTALAACTETTLESGAMQDFPVVTGLHFVGLAKPVGLFDWVVTAQEIAVTDDQGRKIVSRR
ncbi:Bcpks5 [Hyaloscypha variabilis]